MAQVDAITFEAVQKVIDNKDEKAEWEDDQMRSALLELERGATQPEVVENRDITQGTISKRYSELKEYKSQLEEEFSASEGLFTDPVERASSELVEFFEELNEEYSFGIKEIAMKMISDEVKQRRELPTPMNVGQFLDKANSGISNGQELDWIVRRYDNWYKQKQQQLQNNPDYAGGSTGGVPIGGGGSQYGQSQMGGGGQSYGGSSGMSGTGQGQSPQMPQGGPQQNPQQQGPQQYQHQQTDPKVEQLESQVEELTQAVAAVLEDDSDGDDEAEMITIQQEDGSVTLPADDPRVDQLIGSSEPDFMEQIGKLAEIGLVDLGNDDGNEMAQAVGNAIEELGAKQVQAQQQMSQNFQQVLQSMQSMQEQDDDISLQDVEEVIENKLSEDETDRLQREIQSLREEVKSPSGMAEGRTDPDFLKTNREMEFKEKQLETLNQNLREMPEAIAVSIRDGFVPALKEIQFSKGAGANGQQLWQPPQQRGEPQYNPDPKPDPTDRRPRSEQIESDQNAQRSQDEMAERADSVRDSLGLNDDGADERGAEA